MGLRVLASVCYIGLIALMTRLIGVSRATEIVYLFAVCFVSSNLGRFGADQQIAKSAKYFRNGFGYKAGSLVATHAAFSVTTVPLVALLIHQLARPAITREALDLSAGLSMLSIGLSSAGLALAQTAAASWQASSYPSVSVIVFPLFTYLALALFCLAMPNSNLDTYALAFVIPGLIGLLALALKGNIRFMPVRFQLLRNNGYFYIMGLSFYITAWLPFVYLPSLLSAANVVTLNLAVRLSSIQSLPSNAIAGYLMPQFAMNAHNGEYHKIEKTMQQVIGITLIFQILYIAGLSLLYVYFAKMSGLNVPGLLEIIVLLSLGQMASGLTGPVGPALLMLGQQKAMATLSFLFCTTGAALGYIVTQRYGAIGFAGVTALFMGLQNITYIWLLYTKLGLNPYRLKKKHKPKKRV